MDAIFRHLLQGDERPFVSDADITPLIPLMTESRLSLTPVIAFSWRSSRANISGPEIVSNLKKFKGVIATEEEGDGLLVTFSSLLHCFNLVKFFILANQVEFNPYIFYMSFLQAREAVKPPIQLKDRPQEARENKENKKKGQNCGNKYTARIYFFIESTQSFELSKKIIGKKGANMKGVLTECELTFKDGKVPRDFLKLRLRGKGSSYKEGASLTESDEDLHLCISAKNAEVLRTALALIERLLEGIFKEYLIHAKKHGLKPVKKLYRLISDIKNN